jgi:hypothetical protein
MPTDVEQLATIKSQTLQLIRDITAAPKPTYDIDGQSVGWNDYLARLQSLVGWCDERLAGAAPFEIDSQATT